MQKAIQIGKKSATGSFHHNNGYRHDNLGETNDPRRVRIILHSPNPIIHAILFRDWGVNSAITRYIAGLRAENKEEHAYEIVVSGMLFEAATGIVLSVILISLSIIASTVFQRPEISFLIIVAATTIFAGGPPSYSCSVQLHRL